MKYINDVKQILHQITFILTQKQKRSFYGLFIITLIGSLLEMIGIYVILPFIQAVMNPEELLKNKAFSYFVKGLHVNDARGVLLLMGIVVVIVYIIMNSFLVFVEYRRNLFRCDFKKDLSVKMLKTYMKRPYSFFINTNSARVLKSIEDDADGVYFIFDNGFRLIAELTTTALIGVFIVSIDMIMAVGILGIAFVTMLIILFGFKGKLIHLGEQQREASIQLGKQAGQAIWGYKEIKVMHRAKTFQKIYESSAEDARKINVSFNYISSLPEKIIGTVCICGMISLVCIRLLMEGNTASFIPKLATFAVAAFRIIPAISRISSRINTVLFYRPSLNATYNNVIEVNEYEKELEAYKNENKNPEITLKENTSMGEKQSFDDKLEIKNVAWKYEDAEDYVFKDISITIKKGESVGFIGASGAGKTTLADIILGLMRPKKGKILVDGVDVYLIPKQWSRIIGYVPQVVYLTDESIKKNVAFGIPENEIDEQLIWNALEQAQLKTFVEQLPEQLETRVGERGVKFSGGQRQRVAIARALYCNPEILVLDEATSALDNETENAVMESINALQGSKTLIIVAHRLTTIINCDAIYEIKNEGAQLRNKEDIIIGKQSGEEA
ncbi:MAG: ABC transporter ATP-binding protein [Lachnospiraceae bacterium]|nr:ABC transporter ATP-binding protein [Lachnospiraceae bacterium]